MALGVGLVWGWNSYGSGQSFSKVAYDECYPNPGPQIYGNYIGLLPEKVLKSYKLTKPPKPQNLV